MINNFFKKQLQETNNRKVLHQKVKQNSHDTASLVYTISPDVNIKDVQEPAIREIIELVGSTSVLYSSNEIVDGLIFDFLNEHLNIANKKNDFDNLSVYNCFDFINIINNDTAIIISFDKLGTIKLCCRDKEATNIKYPYQRDNFENIVKSSLDEKTICSSRTISSAGSHFLVLDTNISCKQSTAKEVAHPEKAKIIPLFPSDEDVLKDYRTLTCKNDGYIITPNGVEYIPFEDKTKILNDITNPYQINIANDFVDSSLFNAIKPFYSLDQALYFKQNNGPLKNEEQTFIRNLQHKKFEELATYIVNQYVYDSKSEKECDRKLLLSQLKRNPEQAENYLRGFRLDNNIITTTMHKVGIEAIQNGQNFVSIVNTLCTSRTLKFETQKYIEKVLQDTVSSYGDDLQDVQVTFYNNLANIIRVTGKTFDDTIIEIGKEETSENSQDMYKNCRPNMRTTTQTITVRNASLCTESGNVITNAYSNPPSSNIYTKLDFSDTKPVFYTNLVDSPTVATTTLDICSDETDSSMFIQKSFSKHIEKSEEEPYDSPTLTRFISNVSTNSQGEIAITPVESNSFEQ